MGDEFISRRSLGRKTKRSTSEEYYLAKTGGLHGVSLPDMGDLYDDDDNVDDEGDDNAHVKTDTSSSSLPSFAPQEPMLPCEFCTELVKLSDFEGHQLECGRVRGVLRPAQIALAAARAQALATAANAAIAGGGGTGRGPGGQQRAAQATATTAAGSGTAVAAAVMMTATASAAASHPVMGGIGLYRQQPRHPYAAGGAGGNIATGIAGGGGGGGGGAIAQGPGPAGFDRGVASRRNPHGRVNATVPVRTGALGSDQHPNPNPRALVGPGSEMETEASLMGEEDEDVEVTPAALGVEREHEDGNDQPLRGVMQAILGALTATTANTARAYETTNMTSPHEAATAFAAIRNHHRRLIHHHHQQHQAELARPHLHLHEQQQQQRVAPMHHDQEGRRDDNMPPLIPVDDEDDASPPTPNMNNDHTAHAHLHPPAHAGGVADFGYPFQGTDTPS